MSVILISDLVESVQSQVCKSGLLTLLYDGKMVWKESTYTNWVNKITSWTSHSQIQSVVTYVSWFFHKLSKVWYADNEEDSGDPEEDAGCTIQLLDSEKKLNYCGFCDKLISVKFSYHMLRSKELKKFPKLSAKYSLSERNVNWRGVQGPALRPLVVIARFCVITSARVQGGEAPGFWAFLSYLLSLAESCLSLSVSHSFLSLLIKFMTDFKDLLTKSGLLITPVFSRLSSMCAMEVHYALFP